MEILNSDIIRWTGEGLEDGADILLIIKDTAKDCHYPYWVMPGESIEEARKNFMEPKEVVDIVSLSLMRELFI